MMNHQQDGPGPAPFQMTSAWSRAPIPSWLKVLLIVWCVLAGVGWLFNGGEVRLEEPFERYQIRDYRVPQDKTWVSPEGRKIVRHWIEKRTRPVISPLTLIWQHFWYNCFTSGYDLNFWIEERNSSLPSYGIYQSGYLLFLRVEPSCWHRVLVTDFTPQELRGLLASYTVPIPAEMPPAKPAEALPAEMPPAGMPSDGPR